MFAAVSGLQMLGDDDLKGSLLKSKDISPEQMAIVTNIVQVSYFLPHLLNLEECVRLRHGKLKNENRMYISRAPTNAREKEGEQR